MTEQLPKERPETAQRQQTRTPVTPEMRRLIIAQSQEGKGCTTIAGTLGLKRTTVSTIVSKFYATGQVDAKSRGGKKPSKLSPEQKESIVGWIDDNCLLTLAQLVKRVSDEFGVTVSKSCIDRILHSFHYTIKNAHPVPERRNCDRIIEDRFNYAQEFRRLEQIVSNDSFLFLDEVGFQVCTRPKKGRSPAGTRATTTVPQARSRNISVVAVMNINGLLYHKIHDRAVTGEDFNIRLQELRESLRTTGINSPVLIMDNARIHHYKNLNFDGFQILYLPAYCPFLNPIENCFSKWKNLVVRNQCNTEEQLKVRISSAFREITSSDCAGYYRNMLRYLNMSSNRQEIEY